MFELSIPIDPFEDGDVYDCRDNIDNNNIVEDKKEDVKNVTNIGGDVDKTLTQPLRQTQLSIASGY